MNTEQRHRREDTGHIHSWGRSAFIGGLEVRHCTKDCPATQAKEHEHWERI